MMIAVRAIDTPLSLRIGKIGGIIRPCGTYGDSAHCKTLLYRALYEFVASGSKLRSSLAKNLVSFLAWVKVGSLQDIAVNDEGGKFLQKRDLQY